MNKPLLRKLARLLDLVPPANFDMGTYGRASRAVVKSPVCATRACVMGWATTLPEVQRAGLELGVRHPDQFSADLFWRGQFISGGQAAERLFGISDEQAAALVYAGADDPKAKAREIRTMLEESTSRD